jgi:hypothetical protein
MGGDLDFGSVSDSARKFMLENGISLRPHVLTLDYSFWTVGPHHLYPL